MPTIDISDASIRRWANNYGYAPGARGPLKRDVALRYAEHHELSTERKLRLAEQRIEDLERQGARDQAVIRSLQAEINGLREEVDFWRDKAVILAGVVHSED